MKNSTYLKKKESRENSKREFDNGSTAFFLKLKQKPILTVYKISTESTNPHYLSSDIVVWVVDTLQLRSFMIIQEHTEEDNSTNETRGIFCHPPFVYLKGDNYTICGLSSILRFILKFASTKLLEEDQEKDISRGKFLESLLGFRGGCLQACKEVSVWTKFCEDEALVLLSLKDVPDRKIPDALRKFESHLASPVRLFNAMSLNESPVHSFAEGPECNLSDLILYPAISSSLKKFGSNMFSEHLPRTLLWLKRVQTELGLESLPEIDLIKNPQESSVESNRTSEDFQTHEGISLYKKDPSRDKKGHDKNKFFTRQKDVENALLAIESLELGKPFLPVLEVDSIIDWKVLPDEVNPCAGFLPDGRKDRKGQQLGAMVLQISKIVKELRTQSSLTHPIKVVDFCAGGGHVGILVAALLKSEVSVILVENKAESLRRASERINSMSLSNVSLVESNLDYFIGDFDVGVALHACGSATDLVLSKCIAKCKSFVVSPCCYGAVTNQPPVLSYPLSRIFQANHISLESYLTLAHAADQTHGKNSSKSNQGKQAMIAIDSDRLIHAIDCNANINEGGYSCSLVKMPEEASPKNHILVGLFVKSKHISSSCDE